jgi:hypothetical protein
MSKKFSSDVSFETTLLNREVCIEFTRTTTVGWENYGADADGNRGMMMLMVDEDVYENVSIEWEDDDGKVVKQSLEKIKEMSQLEAFPPLTWEVVFAAATTAKDLYQKIVEALDAYLESHEHEPPEEEERDWDVDRDERDGF